MNGGSGPRLPLPFARWESKSSFSKTFQDYSKEEIMMFAYAAGLIDGEGTISIWKSKAYYCVAIQIGMSRKAKLILEWMQKSFGGSVRQFRAATEKWEAGWQWNIFGASAERFLYKVRPFLILKREQAEIALELFSIQGPKNTKTHHDLYLRMKSLNLKGPQKKPVPSLGTPFATYAEGTWWKTQGTLFPEASGQYCETWPKWGLLLRGECYELPTWAPAINAPACSSWPSARAEDAECCGNHSQAADSLTGTTQAWHTPSTEDCKTDGQMVLSRYGTVEMKTSDQRLRNQAMQWPTPTEADERGHAQYPHNPTLPGITQLWATPTEDNVNNQGGPSRMKGMENGGYLDLTVQVATWPTPAARDVKGTNDPSHMERSTGSLHLDQLPNFVEHKFSRPAPLIHDGPESLPTGPASPRRLNPAFVCWLMGWPWWWTNPAPISFAPAAMALYRSRLRSLLESLLRGS